MIETEVLARLADEAEESGELDRARDLFERGAALGDTVCLTRLALIYDVGLGVTPDKPRAMSLYRRAWRLDRSTVAASNIAFLYREQSRYRPMFQWLERAAAAGDGDSLLAVAKCYLDGSGVRRNVQAGVRALAAAKASEFITEAGREEARALLGTLAPKAI